MKNQLLTKTAYDEESSFRYDEKRFTTPQGKLCHELELRQLVKVARKIEKNSKVLEVGCGTGRFIYEMLKRGNNVWGVDPSPFMLEVASKKCAGFSNVHFNLAEGVSLPYPNEFFDFVYAIRVLNHTESRDYAIRMIKEMMRVTKSGGLLLIEFCNHWRPFKFGNAVRLSIRDIKTIVKEFYPARIVDFDGILFLSLTLLNHTPKILLPLFEKIDSFFSHKMPWLAARCYVIIER